MTGIRDALLIATGEYESQLLDQLRSPIADASELAGVLADPDIGWFKVQQLVDASAYRITQAIEKFFRQRSADDLLVLHLSCHGIKDDDGSLYFAAADTDLDLLGSTAVPADFLQRQLDRCRARSIVVLLDCCYSGAFLPGMKGSITVDAQDQLAGSGRAVLTASSRTEYAWESARVVDLESAAPSVFTEAVVHGLRTGEADRDQDGQVAVDELYHHVYERLHTSGARQTPRLWSELEYRVFLARSTRVVKPATDAVAEEPPRVWPQRRARRGDDVLIRVNFSLEELVLGAEREVKVETKVACAGCGGPGTSADSKVSRCRSCSGHGTRSAEEVDDCAECGGFGTLIQNPCPRCDGEGRVSADRKITFRAPPGVYEGVRIQLSNQSEVGRGGGPAGDLYIEVAEQPDKRYIRTGKDLYRSQPLTVPAELAAEGGLVELETVDGIKRLRIPAGAVSGQRLRVPGLGLAELKTDNPVKQRGDLFVDISIEKKPRRR